MHIRVYTYSIFNDAIFKYRFFEVRQGSQRRNIDGCGRGVRTSIGTLTSTGKHATFLRGGGERRDPPVQPSATGSSKVLSSFAQGVRVPPFSYHLLLSRSREHRKFRITSPPHPPRYPSTRLERARRNNRIPSKFEREMEEEWKNGNEMGKERGNDSCCLLLSWNERETIERKEEGEDCAERA